MSYCALSMTIIDPEKRLPDVPSGPTMDEDPLSEERALRAYGCQTWELVWV